jgi:hypothetical protein
MSDLKFRRLWMAHEVVQHQLRERLRKAIIVIVLLILGSAALYVGYMQYSLYLAKKFVPIPSDASNLRAFYVGIGQNHTVYIRFDLAEESEDMFWLMGRTSAFGLRMR